ncbi:hypothetical protein ACS0PU_000622 [Formica fusca]
MATPDPVDPATLEIKTRSIEQTLLPLVKQKVRTKIRKKIQQHKENIWIKIAYHVLKIVPAYHADREKEEKGKRERKRNYLTLLKKN